MNYKKCYNFQDFRSLAKSKLPSPIFNYIDGAADDEVTYRRNTSSFDDVSLIPSVLCGVKDVDISTTIFGKKLDLPFYLAPTALQRLFHYEGERAVGKAAQKFKNFYYAEEYQQQYLLKNPNGYCGIGGCNVSYNN